MEHSYESAAALVRAIRGATAEHLVAFVGSLIGQQYSVSYVCQLAQHALAFGHWCEDRRISFHALKDDDIVRYQRLRSRRRSRCFETRRRELHALELLMRFLRERGVCHVAQTRAIAADEVVEPSVIALWLGHESLDTTQVYLDANLTLKQAVLDRTTPPKGTPGRYRPDDRLLTFLKGL